MLINVLYIILYNAQKVNEHFLQLFLMKLLTLIDYTAKIPNFINILCVFCRMFRRFNKHTPGYKLKTLQNNTKKPPMRVVFALNIIRSGRSSYDIPAERRRPPQAYQEEASYTLRRPHCQGQRSLRVSWKGLRLQALYL